MFKYKQVLGKFQEFARSYRLTMAFPIRPLTLAKFGAWLFLKKKLKTSTVSQYVAIMGWWHCIKGLPDPSKQLLIKRFLVGLRKEAPPPRQADPNRFGQVLKIIQELEASTPPAERVLLKVVFFLAYYASSGSVSMRLPRRSTPSP